ncbi:TIGR01777 family oxidoreductase [Mangrovibacillus cuniculi]|uniref:TIGR01777 family protein n=1 Tax=Mangrovibacillus cuniculi TaxID=2593652 RepID=A0A7S8HEI9_9BACI|nr:TIGR01777 family oxidoreductase [Mangrovibacillus cuniculi]QPC45772.1 TIGR01777 family protein [Mangrovibacillus cuniculi]
MKIAIAGGTGFVGKGLTNYFLENEHEVVILTRSEEKTSSHPRLSYVTWLKESAQPELALSGVDVVINLAGTSINSGRWTDEVKESILKSRVNTTKELLRIMKVMEPKPSTFINASAIGIYQTSEDATYREDSLNHGDDFLATTVSTWENLASEAESLGIRTVYTRFGIILGKDEGALPAIAMPYKLFAGGTVGTGRQWLSWIHWKDVVRAIDHCMNNTDIKGPVNLVSPHPLRMKEFGKTVADALNRPHWIPAPSFALKALLGEKSILVLEGQHVLPTVLQHTNFTFAYPTLKDALEDIYEE